MTTLWIKKLWLWDGDSRNQSLDQCLPQASFLARLLSHSANHGLAECTMKTGPAKLLWACRIGMVCC
jgi:hypothetical protein